MHFWAECVDLTNRCLAPGDKLIYVLLSSDEHTVTVLVAGFSDANQQNTMVEFPCSVLLHYKSFLFPETS